VSLISKITLIDLKIFLHLLIIDFLYISNYKIISILLMFFNLNSIIKFF